MEQTRKQQWTHASAGFIAGLVALILVTAIIAAAVTSSNAEERLSTAIASIQAVADQQEATRVQQAEMQADLDRRERLLAKDRRLARARDAELRRRIYALTVFLREHGVPVPGPESMKQSPRSGGTTSGAPGSAPVPDQPGKSDNHRKNPKP